MRNKMKENEDRVKKDKEKRRKTEKLDLVDREE